MDDIATQLTLATLALPQEEGGARAEEKKEVPVAFDREQLLRLAAAARVQSEREEAEQAQEAARHAALQAQAATQQAAQDAVTRQASELAAQRAAVEAAQAEEAEQQVTAQKDAQRNEELRKAQQLTHEVAARVAQQAAQAVEAAQRTKAGDAAESRSSKAERSAAPEPEAKLSKKKKRDDDGDDDRKSRRKFREEDEGKSDQVRSLVASIAGAAKITAAANAVSVSAAVPPKPVKQTPTPARQTSAPSAKASSAGTASGASGSGVSSIAASASSFRASVGGSFVPSFFPPAVTQAAEEPAGGGGRRRSPSRSRDRERKRRRYRSGSRSPSRTRKPKRSSIFTESGGPSTGAQLAKLEQSRPRATVSAPPGAGIPGAGVPTWMKDLVQPGHERKFISMPQAWVKSLLGKGGETIRYIVNRTGANVQIKSKSTDENGVISIEGNVQLAERMIWEVLAQKGCVVPAGGLYQTAGAPAGYPMRPAR